MADEAKAKGNAAFAAGNFSDAVRHFSDAISMSPTNHVLYSNRSAAYASLSNYSAALSDAKKTVELKPDWSKGYSRLGASHVGLHNYNDAVEAYKKGLEIDPNNEALKSGLSDAQSAAETRSKPPNPFGDAFGPEMWAKLTSDPSTMDPRVMQALGVFLTLSFKHNLRRIWKCRILNRRGRGLLCILKW